jgi:hypothetical protein
MDKHSSLLRKSVNYDRKKFYSTGLWCYSQMLHWKVIARYKHSSLFGLVVSNEEIKFNNIDTWVSMLYFFLRHLRRGKIS